MAPKVIRVTVINDFICVFCYIGHLEIQNAIQRCSDLNVRFDVQYRPYQLASCLVEDQPIERRPYYLKKYGQAKLEALIKSIQEWSDRLELGMSITGEGVMSSTVRAHRLSLKAFLIGGQSLQLPVMTKILKAFCADQKDVGEIEVLAEIAEEAGMMPKEEAIEFLKSDDLKDDVLKMTADAKIVGVKGVPVTIIEGKWTVHGAQPADTYVQIFRRLASAAPDLAHESPPHSPVTSSPVVI